MASVRKYFGEVGLSIIDPKLLRFDQTRSEAIVACQKNHETELQAALALMNEIAGSRIAPLTIRVSGTIKGLSTHS
jgi:RNase P/RNase MRP subunit POP5